MPDFEFFYGGPFSQWYKSPFEIDGCYTFNTCEQWMMWNKASLFGDNEIGNKILLTEDPAEQKALGRKVKNFNDDIWMLRAYDIVLEGNLAKFTQNTDLREKLKSTCGKLLVEASQYDTRWGIGLSMSDPLIYDMKNWRGSNLLGNAITEVRLRMFGE